jgi:hypothetical protein
MEENSSPLTLSDDDGSSSPSRAETVPPTDPAAVAARYADAWQAQDWPALRAILAEDVTFEGPMGRAANAEECITGLQRMAQTLERIEVRLRLSDDRDVLTWFDLHSTVAPPTPTVNWSRVDHGKITAIRVTFDPRATLEGLARRSG